MCTERFLGGRRGRGRHLIVSGANLPTASPLCWNPSGLKAVHAHMGRLWDKSNTDPEPGKARWLVKRNPELPHESDSNDCAWGTLSEPVYVSIHGYFTLFPPNKHFVSLLFVFVGILFCNAKEPSLLMAQIQHSSCHYPTSVSGWEPKPCFKLLQAEAIWDQGDCRRERSHQSGL